MTLEGFMVITSAWVIFIVASTLMLYPHYEDGIFGRIALGGMVGVTALPLWDHFHYGTQYDLLITTAAFYVAVALFITRHFYRFYKWHNCGLFSFGKTKTALPEQVTRVDYLRLGRIIIYWAALIATAIALAHQ
jgi:hypothetical protein